MKLPEGFQVVNDTQILGFFNEYRFLSNFHPCEILIDGIVYPSTEHAYMAYKTDDVAIKQKIAKLVKPSDAKEMGNTVKLRSDWNYFRVAAMLNCLHLKFNPETELAKMLLATGDKYLEETNWWHDEFWGVYKPVLKNFPGDAGPGGMNMLGKCLMIVRGNLRYEDVTTWDTLRR